MVSSRRWRGPARRRTPNSTPTGPANPPCDTNGGWDRLRRPGRQGSDQEGASTDDCGCRSCALSRSRRPDRVRFRRRLGNRRRVRALVCRTGLSRGVHRHRGRAVGSARGGARRVRALLALRRARRRGAARRDRGGRRDLRAGARAREQRGARRPPPDGGRDARVLGRQSRRQPAASLLRRAGGRAADGRRRRRVDHQSRLHLLDARPAGDGRLHDVEGGDLRD